MISRIKNGIVSLAVLTSLGASTAKADDVNWVEAASGVYMIMKITTLGIYGAVISSAGTLGTVGYVGELNDEKRRELDQEIERVYRSDHEILVASQQADEKIRKNKEALKTKEVRKNESRQKTIKENIHLWMRIKERGKKIEKENNTKAARQQNVADGLALGS